VSRLRVNVWGPLPPSPSGIADYTLEQMEALRHHVDVVGVVEEPAAVEPAIHDVFPIVGPEACGAADLDLYQLGNSPAHDYVCREAARRSGVALLHEWNLHHLVLHQTVEQGDVAAYLRQMRRAYGETGSFVGRQVARGLGGELLPALFPLNERVLARSLAVVGLTGYTARRAAEAMPGRPVLHLPHHLSLPVEASREEARRALGLPHDARIVTCPGLATANKRLHVVVRAFAQIAVHDPEARLVVAGDVAPDVPLAALLEEAGIARRTLVTGRLSLQGFVRHIAAADVVINLRFPTYGEISGALVRALGLGRAVVVTDGTPAAEEFPSGVVVAVDPGPYESAELQAVVEYLLGDARARNGIGRAARDHVLRHHGLAATAHRLAEFLGDVASRRADLLRLVDEDDAEPGSLRALLADEVRWAARDLGLAGFPTNVGPLLAEIAAARR
jgi:glycosyltransferase involved in cell wall biosynthesis